VTATLVPAPDIEREHRFAPRRVRFDYAGTPVHWVPGDPHTTHVANVLHLLLPAGEGWFVDVYRKALPLIDDAPLRRDVKAFIGQEATHARAHTVVLDHLAERGIDPTGFTRLVEWGFHQGRPRVMWSWLPAPVRSRLDRSYLLWQLAVISAIEHFTAVLGWWIVVTRGLDRAGADPEMMALLRWHGAEEVEHRSVAFDAYRAVGGGYLRRAVAMLGVFVAMAVAWYAGTWFLMRQDPAVTSRKRASLRRFRQASKLDRMPPVSTIVRAVPRYLAPRYHPSHECRTQVAVDHLASVA
jgi:hypothetical protein